MVARHTRASDVLSDVRAAFVVRHHMVNSEILCLFAAVLANVTVSEEHFLSRKAVLLDRPFHHVDEPDDRRDIKDCLRRTKFPSAILQHLRFFST